MKNPLEMTTQELYEDLTHCPVCGEKMETPEYGDCGKDECSQEIQRRINKERIKGRLEYLRMQLQNGEISWNECHELQSLAEYIPEDDTELLEAAGVPEGKSEIDVLQIQYIDDMTEDGRSPEEVVIDLLADIRHYCDLTELDFAEMDRKAYNHYQEELSPEN